MADKAPDAFRTITEVSEWLDTPTYVLRFWESRFSQIKPVKRAGGRRYYRPEDMQLLGGIKTLLHFEEHTIKAVKEILKDKGVKHVMSLSPDLDTPVETPVRDDDRKTASEIDEMVAAAEKSRDKLSKPTVGVRVVKKDEPAEAETDAETETAETAPAEPATDPQDQPAQAGADVPAETADDTAPAEDSEPADDTVAAVAADTPAKDSPKKETPVAKHKDNQQDDDSGEEWQRMDPMIVENVPYRVRSSRMYTQRQLADIETLYSELSAVRDRMQASR